jgi:DNA polymerase-3 subunit beta
VKLLSPLSAFQSAFQVAAAAVPARTPKPVLQNVRLSVSRGAAKLQGTSQELAATATVDGVESAGELIVLLPAVRVGAFLGSVSGETLSIELQGDSAIMRVDKSKFAFPTANPMDFPSIKAIEAIAGEKCYRAPASTLRAALKRVAFAADPSAGRFALQCVCLDCAANVIDFVACDSRRFAWQPVSVEAVAGYQPPARSLLPQNATRFLDRILAVMEGDVRLLLTGNEIFLASDCLEISARLSEGVFPKWRDLVGIRKTVEARVNATELAAAISCVRPATDEDSLGIDVTLSSGRAVLRTESANVGEAETSVSAEYDGPVLDVSLNHKFLTEYLRVIGEAELTAQVVDGDSLVMFLGPDEHRYGVMPLARGEK